MSAIYNKIFTITAITFISTLAASPSFAGVLCNVGEKRVRQDVIIADAFSEECFASCASKSDQATYNAPPGWAVVRHWTGTRHDRGRTTRNLTFATAQSNFASSSDFSSARSQEASGSAGQYNAGYSAGAKQIEGFHNSYRASNTTITLTVTAQGRSPYAGSSKREEALNVEELCIGTIDDYRAAIRDELSLTGSNSFKLPAGLYRVPTNGAIFYTNGKDAYCDYSNEEHFSFAVNKSFSPTNSLPSLRYDGPCSITLPEGNYRQLDGFTFYSNGKDSFCSYRRVPEGSIRQLNQSVPYGRFMRNDGVCAGQ
jgi:hypothetical protein